jgi:hypothetical protein
VDAPAGFKRTLDGLPPRVTFATRPSKTTPLVIWFVLSRRALEGRIDTIAPVIVEGSGLWIAWPKKASGVVTDLTEDVIRTAGLARGLVDYKVCAVSEIWSGLKFARRKR